MDLRSSRRNPYAKALRSPHLRKQIVADKTKKCNRQVARAKLKQGKYDQKYDLPLLYSSRIVRWLQRESSSHE